MKESRKESLHWLIFWTYGAMAQWLNLGYITYISIKNHSFKSSLIGFYKASRSTSTCLKIYKPLRLCNKKIIQFKCGEIAGPHPGKPFWRNERLYHIFSRRSYSTYPRSFIRRKEILILIFAGKVQPRTQDFCVLVAQGSVMMCLYGWEIPI